MTRLAIAAMGRHGEGVAELGGRRVFVPFTLPGETVEAEVNGDRGRLVAVIAAAAERITPHCPQFGACGGCAVQHWAEAPYRDWKRSLVTAALAHRGLEAAVADVVDGHGVGRRRAVLHVAGAKVGFRAARSHRLVAIERCPVLAPELAAAPAIAGRLAAALGARAADVQVTATETGLDCDVRGAPEPGLEARAAVAGLAERFDLARVTAAGDLVVERRRPLVTMGRARVTPPPGGFLQATALAEAVLAGLVGEAVGGARRVADLFCGVGPFTLRLAERAAVGACDSQPAAVAALAQAARTTQGLKPVEARVRDLFRDPLSAGELAGFDAVVLDPPRAGCEAQARVLAGARVGLVVMVSCDPASFARDAAILTAGGLRLDRVTPVDQFRHTGHVELVGVFRR